MISGRLQSDEHGVGVNLDVGFHRESFPEQIKKISIHRGGGGLANFVVLANSKLTGFTAVSYFFTLTRDEPFLWASLGSGSVRLYKSITFCTLYFN